MKQELDSRMENHADHSPLAPNAAAAAGKGPIETDAVIVGAGPVGLF